jgi:hypothetical protein
MARLWHYSTLYTDAVMGGEAETVHRMRVDQLQAAAYRWRA